MRRALFHLHTQYSFDSLSSPSKIVERAFKQGINYLVISDHDSLTGSIKANEYAQLHEIPIEIPIAAEYNTDIGDVIAVGVTRDFQKIYDHRELCRAVKSLGGYTALPHPFAKHNLDQIDFSLIDCIEVFNSRCNVENNKRALELALKLSKPTIFGSDAHFLEDLFNCLFIYSEKNPFEGQVFPLQLSYTSKFRINSSQIIKSFKTRDPRLAIRMLKKITKDLYY